MTEHEKLIEVCKLYAEKGRLMADWCDTLDELLKKGDYSSKEYESLSSYIDQVRMRKWEIHKVLEILTEKKILHSFNEVTYLKDGKKVVIYSEA